MALEITPTGVKEKVTPKAEPDPANPDPKSGDPASKKNDKAGS